MRRLAREAVIFILLTSLLVFVGLSVLLSTSPHSSFWEIVGPSALDMWMGIPVGLGLWILYRAVRFAVKG